MKEKSIQLIEKEIKWCEDNKQSVDLSEDYKKGFIKGLEQALFFIKSKSKQLKVKIGL